MLGGIATVGPEARGTKARSLASTDRYSVLQKCDFALPDSLTGKVSFHASQVQKHLNDERLFVSYEDIMLFLLDLFPMVYKRCMQAKYLQLTYNLSEIHVWQFLCFSLNFFGIYSFSKFCRVEAPWS